MCVCVTARACVCVVLSERVRRPLCVSASLRARVCVRSVRAHTPYPWRTPRTSRCARARARAGGRARRGRCNRVLCEFLCSFTRALGVRACLCVCGNRLCACAGLRLCVQLLLCARLRSSAPVCARLRCGVRTRSGLFMYFAPLQCCHPRPLLCVPPQPTVSSVLQLRPLRMNEWARFR